VPAQQITHAPGVLGKYALLARIALLQLVPGLHYHMYHTTVPGLSFKGSCSRPTALLWWSPQRVLAPTARHLCLERFCRLAFSCSPHTRSTLRPQRPKVMEQMSGATRSSIERAVGNNSVIQWTRLAFRQTDIET
jgi:hypothetical protein